ncbi:MAG TPA: hypothetical protein VLK65_01440 [Vicinamibacteria bacterium]|nr:hypothetical protein [Vicinamibacteria bacterium]
MTAALGFAPHSGWAAVVAVAGDAGHPTVVYRGRIEMADSTRRDSRQPYHAVESLPLVEAERRLADFSASALRLAVGSVSKIADELRAKNSPIEAAGILDSSGRKGGNLEAILASHALIHTADGDHFREALEAACQRSDLRVVRVRKSDLLTRALAVLGTSSSKLEEAVRAMGKPFGPPWGADQKSAALLAWLLLADPISSTTAARRES